MTKEQIHRLIKKIRTRRDYYQMQKSLQMVADVLENLVDEDRKGEQGPQGLQGERGEKGEKGEKGDKGDSATLTLLNATGDDSYVYNVVANYDRKMGVVKIPKQPIIREEEPKERIVTEDKHFSSSGLNFDYLSNGLISGIFNTTDPKIFLYKIEVLVLLKNNTSNELKVGFHVKNNKNILLTHIRQEGESVNERGLVPMKPTEQIRKIEGIINIGYANLLNLELDIQSTVPDYDFILKKGSYIKIIPIII